ncbi:MAG: hypothetical protein WCW52_10060 [Elusimicrobiales bacterium]
MKKMLSWLILSGCLARGAFAGNLTGHVVSVVDAGGLPRTSFSNSETVTLRQQVNNAVQGAGMINFTFKVLNPAGAAAFTHTGNAAPSTPGLSQTQISGVPISSFYSTPGNYSFQGTATLDGETSAPPAAVFTVSSPNITLIYPPSGAVGLSDTPLIFRWVGSGASQYRITVGENAGLYNPVHQSVNTGETLFSYPQNPSVPREQLVPQQLYYWKVEGLDAAGNTISQSNVYSFSLRNQAASQSRNITVTDLNLSTPLSDRTKPLNFKAVVYNAGNSAETNVGIKMSLGGLSAQDSPKQIQVLTGGERKEVPFTAFMPSDQDSSLAVVCVDVFDDNLTDNCRTKLIAKETGGAGAGGGPSKKLSYDELWAELKKRLGPDALRTLDGYTFQSIDCAACSGSELNDLLAALISGEATLSGASILETGGAAAPAAPQAGPAAAAAAAQEEPPGMDLEVLKQSSFQDEWTGYASAFSKKETSTFVVAEKKEWKKLWQSLSESELPEVDFSHKMVLGIVSAADDRAETIRILSRRRTDEGLTVDYYFIQAPQGKELPAAAYILKATDKEAGKVNFRRLDGGK